MSPRFRHGGRMVACAACILALSFGARLTGHSTASSGDATAHSWAGAGGGGGHGK
jgi:hypothetical protein